MRFAYVVGCGKLTGLRLPSPSTARTPKRNLSYEIPFTLEFVTFPTSIVCVHVGSTVSR